MPNCKPISVGSPGGVKIHDPFARPDHSKDWGVWGGVWEEGEEGEVRGWGGVNRKWGEEVVNKNRYFNIAPQKQETDNILKYIS